MQEKPRIAIVDSNTLAVIGLKLLLQEFMPVMEVESFGSMAELQANQPERYVHYFVSMNIVLEHRRFFTEHRRKTIVLTQTVEGGNLLSEFHCLCVNVPEKELVRSLLILQQYGHRGGKNLHASHMPDAQDSSQQKLLTDREIEVMTYIVQGYINKEIADRLHIGLSTVVTHRKNIMEKLGAKSVSALTIYAVLNGYVDINKI